MVGCVLVVMKVDEARKHKIPFPFPSRLNLTLLLISTSKTTYRLLGLHADFERLVKSVSI